MGDLWILLFLSLSLAGFHGVKGCLECDPSFTEDVRTLLGNLVPQEVPERNQFLERHNKEITHLSSKVSHKDKMFRLLAVRNVFKLRVWLKDELHRLGNETWKGVFITQGKLLAVHQNLENKLTQILKNFSEVVVIEGPILDCWTCLRMTTRCFKGDYCQDMEPRKAENQEISLYLIFIAEAVILASALLLFYVFVLHRRKMKVIRRNLMTYLEKKLEELVERIYKDDEKNNLDFGKLHSQSLTGKPARTEYEMHPGT